MLESDFVELLSRYEKGQCTQEEVSRIELWLNTMKEKKPLYENENNKILLKKRLNDSIHEAIGINPTIKPFRVLRTPMWLKVAATIIILVTIGTSIFYFGSHKNYSTTLSAYDKIEKLMLSDGSIIWLKPNSTVTYPRTFAEDKREITFEGEALFEIAKNPNCPFYIHAGGITTKVLGTSFNIKTHGKETEVYLLTGKVEVTSNQTLQKVLLKPKEKAVFAHKTKNLIKIEAPVEISENCTKGTDYEMSFASVRLNDIARRIELKFNVSIKVIGNVGNCLITADLTDQSLYSSLDMITEALNATYKIDHGVIIINGNGCE